MPYAGGFLVSDTRYFEGTVGLNVVRAGRVVDGPTARRACPTRAGGWVTWLVGATARSPRTSPQAAVHRARPDGSEETVREIAPRSVPAASRYPERCRLPDLPRRWYASASAREDAGHVLAVVVQGRGSAAIVRIGPATVAMELATAGRAVRSEPPAYALGPGR